MSNGKGTTADPLIGTVIQGRYRITRLLGEGGMGSVYLADQLSIGRRVAIKVLHGQYARDEEFITRFRREAQSAAALNHHRVVVIYEFGQAENGSLFIAMEYVAGHTLKELIQQGPLPLGYAVRLGLQIAEGLHAAHRAGVIHRDVKPENIMVREGGEIKLMDFGIARMQDAQAHTRLTRTGLIVGTPEYMAPEQIEGTEVTAQTDLYAWGIVMYEMLKGETPFTSPTPAKVLVSHLQQKPPPLRPTRRDVPEAVERVVLQALAKDPRDRQRHMGEVITALQAATGQVEAGAVPGTRVEARPETVTQRSLRKWGVGAALLLGTVVVSATIVRFVGFDKNDLPPIMRREVEVPPPVVTPRPTAPATPKPAAGTTLVEKKSEETAPTVTKPEIAEHLNLGQFYLDRGQYEDALAELETAKKADPNSAEVAAALERVRNAREAESSLSRAR
jgi:predicted Ser/Thr protein kinase